MVSSAAATVSQYLGELPAERRAVVSKVRTLVRKSIPKGYEECMNWGMICWQVPLKRAPDTYNGKPLCYVALAAQKNNYALYLMGPYIDRKQAAALRAARGKSGKKLDMGKSCLRFKALDDLPVEAIGASIASIPVDECIRLHEKQHPRKK
ncbi:hypothetical protein DSM104443_02413 [Usitatibacter rugosus]|uniref:YdhG-like domain-containing protein n=1 Tax=Usitatibacter rugosus TaxID=2732067 RepID=A0A6M4GWT8_9PROT|nr:DUF1801 domain-containing protein [Usitatibacter rugosus]QJR11338.1 hypothetical protein DSM104443_02413 [Usitatibacter rugosus]